MSDLDPNAAPKFEQPQHEKYGIADAPKPQAPRQIAVTPGTLVLFKATEASKQKLLAGKLVSGEDDVLLVQSGSSRYQVPLASVVQLFESALTGHAVLLDPSLCREAVGDLSSALEGLRKDIAELHGKDSEEREFKGEYDNAVIAQRRLNVLKLILKLLNTL